MDLEIVRSFLETKLVSHSNKEPGVGAALGNLTVAIRMNGFVKCSQT